MRSAKGKKEKREQQGILVSFKILMASLVDAWVAGYSFSFLITEVVKKEDRMLEEEEDEHVEETLDSDVGNDLIIDVESVNKDKDDISFLF